MFRVWREMGYIQINPMGLHGAGTVRKVNTNRAVSIDLYEMVFQAMDATDKPTYTARQSDLRARFVFIALRELGGARAS